MQIIDYSVGNYPKSKTMFFPCELSLIENYQTAHNLESLEQAGKEIGLFCVKVYVVAGTDNVSLTINMCNVPPNEEVVKCATQMIAVSRDSKEISVRDDHRRYAEVTAGGSGSATVQFFLCL